MSTLSASRLRELLHYNPDTGVFTWRATRGGFAKAGVTAGRPDSKGHIQISVDGRRYGAHRLAWLHVTGAWPSGQIDHIDTVRHNNRWANLRDVDHLTNCQNKRAAQKNNVVGLLGVTLERSGNYRATIRVSGRKRSLGTFPVAELAHAAYVEAKRKLHEGNTL